MKTVVHFIDANIFGGVEQVMLLFLGALDRATWQPIVFHHGEPGISRVLDEAQRLGIPCQTVPRITRGSMAVALPQFAREIRKVKPAVFHVHLNWPLACRQAAMAARLCNVPATVATCHLFPPSEERYSWFKRRVHNACIDRYIAVSGEVGKSLSENLQIPMSKIRVVQNGVQIPSDLPAVNHALRASIAGDG